MLFFTVRNLPENKVVLEFATCQRYSWQSDIQLKKSYLLLFWQTLLNPVQKPIIKIGLQNMCR